MPHSQDKVDLMYGRTDRLKADESHASDQSRRDLTVLLLDADDTLWENNIYFLQVTDEFTASLQQRGVAREMALRVLTEIETENIAHLGYGSMSFAQSLRDAYLRLDPQRDGVEAARMELLAQSIFERESIELRLGVAEALGRLAVRHRLILLTKGDPREQKLKLDRSGLREHFEWIEVVPEKHEYMYRELLERLQLDSGSTWMIGNSPRSDINPALAAGLGAILIPHPSTWELEIEEIIVPPNARFLVLDNLLDVAEYFDQRSGCSPASYDPVPPELAP